MNSDSTLISASSIEEKKNAIQQLVSMRKEKNLALSDLLLSIRLCDDICQVDFAKKLGIPKQHLCDIEKKRVQIGPAKAVRFARKLGYDSVVFATLALQEFVDKEKVRVKVNLESPL